MSRSALLAVTTVTATLAACSTTTSNIDDSAAHVATSELRIPPPESAVEAQLLLASAVAALDDNQPRRASRLLDALARSDNLTERGRANVYWLLAEAYGMSGDDPQLVDALGGFLVASQVLEGEANMDDRRAQAQAALISAKLRLTPHFGSSPDFAIPVEDARAASTVVERLGCGPRRDMPYTEHKTSALTEGPRVLEQHTLTCTDDGRTMTLWFDVTPL